MRVTVTFYSYTPYFVYLEDMLNFRRRSYFMGWVRESTGSVSLLCADAQKDVSSACMISSSPGFPEDLKESSCCEGVGLPSTLSDTAPVSIALCKRVPDPTAVQDVF